MRGSLFYYRIRMAHLAALCGLFLFSGHIVFASPPLPADLIVCPDPTAQVRAGIVGTTLGEQVTFFVDSSYDSTSRTQLTATLRAAGSKSLVYIEDSYVSSLSASFQQALFDAAIALGNEFDATIYPNLTAFYGPPSEPGIDGDQRITILLTKLINQAGGYMNTGDEYLRSQSPRSNEREMVYLNALYVTQTRRANSFLAHEFTHVITFNQKDKLRSVEEEIWLNELRAEYGPSRAGYDSPFSGSILASRAGTFFANAVDSLTEWKNVETDYGAINLFGHYVAGQYGETVWGRSMQTAARGVASIDEGLAAVGVTDRFADAFQHWETANFLNSTQPGAAYAYKQPDLSGFRVSSPTVSVNIDAGATQTVSRQIEDWAGQWIQAQVVAPNNETLVISASAAVPFRAEVALKKTDGTSVVQPMTITNGTGSLTVSKISSYTTITVVPIMMGKTTGFTTGGPDGYPDEPLRSYTVTFQRVASSSPILTSASPSQLVTFGGATVTLQGSGFSQGTPSVKVDGQTVAATILNDATLTFVAPAHQAGSVCLQVTAKNETNERCDLLSYVVFADGSLLRGEGSNEVWIIQGTFRRHIVSSRVFDFYGHLSWSNVREVSPQLVLQYKLSAWVRPPVTPDPLTWRIYEVNGDVSKHWITCAQQDQCGATWLAHGGDSAGIFTINDSEMSFYTEGPRVFLQ